MVPVIEPDLLQAFVAIAETGSFTEAAGRVGRTQSAVSMQIKRLEELLGRPVFAREGRSVRLTADGEVLLGHAHRILRAHQEALVAFADAELSGTVTLGTPDEYAVTFLPAILARLAETQPLLHVEVVCDTTVSLLQRLAARTVDLAIVTDGLGDHSGEILLREPVVWVTAARHGVHEREPLPLALFHAGCPFRQWALDSLARHGRAYRLAYSSRSFSALEVAVRHGLAVSVLPLSNARTGFRILDERDGMPPLPHYQIALVRASGARSPLLDCVEESIRDRFRTAAATAA